MPDAERRDQAVTFCLTPEELARLTDRAAASGLSVSAYVRGAALGAAVPARRSLRHGHDLGAVVAQLQRLGNNLNQILREARIGHFSAAVASQTGDALEALTRYLLSLAPVDDPET